VPGVEGKLRREANGGAFEPQELPLHQSIMMTAAHGMSPSSSNGVGRDARNAAAAAAADPAVLVAAVRSAGADQRLLGAATAASVHDWRSLRAASEFARPDMAATHFARRYATGRCDEADGEGPAGLA